MPVNISAMPALSSAPRSVEPSAVMSVFPFSSFRNGNSDAFQYAAALRQGATSPPS